ncbi:MAG: alpha/beta fold hydrolase [Anaerolineae bacterium]|jgi:pimeloyl-ACP methyl ester carboxylesterase|nr:alpha/beta fold hydrolase [Anaerolineae bacterium]
MTETPPVSTWDAQSRSILNGLFGDYLQQRQNGLAIDMAFYRAGRPLALTAAALAHAGPRPVILIHGLGCTEGFWTFPHPDTGQPCTYGSLLAADAGCTPFYLRYNTGLSVAENGQRLATLLETLLRHYPVPVTDLLLIGHSMGGLVIRSACYAGQQQHATWIDRVRCIFYLGTPHSGAALAQAAGTAGRILTAIPNPITRLIGDTLNLRSQGIKDLQHGTLHAPDVMDDAPAGTPAHHQRAVPWLASARHYLIGGALTGDPDHAISVLFGDGLVAAPAATASASAAPIPADRVRLFPATDHFKLVRDLAIYQQILAWYAQYRSETDHG